MYVLWLGQTFEIQQNPFEIFWLFLHARTNWIQKLLLVDFVLQNLSQAEIY